MAQNTLTQHELQREQQRLRLALAAGRMCAFDYDVLEDRIECALESHAASSPVLEALGGRLSQFFERVHPDDRPEVERAFRQAITRGGHLHLDARLVVGTTRRTGWLLLEAIVECDDAGRAVSMCGVARDNTARKEGQTVRHAQAHGERLRALGEMASGIAHDLNQSLALITGYGDMARQELSLEDPDLHRVREMVEITARAALEGGHALRGLLTFVRSQEQLAEVERIDLSELLKDVARLTAPRWRDAPQVEGRPIALQVQAQPGLAVSGSPAALREAITNLIFNAVDALPRGGSIWLNTRRQRDRVLIDVRDNGTGIPRDVLPHIFDPFFTTKGERGTGLGLPQVLSIVERHLGTIDVDSDPGRGTTFQVSLPACDPSVKRPAAGSQDRPPAPPRRTIRVLVVEDEEQLARMATLVLTQRGHHAIMATSGEEAVALLEEERPFDLVISDLGLGPGRNGWELAETIRHRWPGTRFVLVTGWGAAINPVEARARGVQQVISKPYRISELRQVADEVAASVANE